jgi:hypothetical protein
MAELDGADEETVKRVAWEKGSKTRSDTATRRT